MSRKPHKQTDKQITFPDSLAARSKREKMINNEVSATRKSLRKVFLPKGKGTFLGQFLLPLAFLTIQGYAANIKTMLWNSFYGNREMLQYVVKFRNPIAKQPTQDKSIYVLEGKPYDAAHSSGARLCMFEPISAIY